MDARTRRDDDTLRLLGILGHEVRHPAKPPHTQKSHGRPGLKGAAKTAVKKAAKAIADAVDEPASKPAKSSAGKFPPKRDMTFRKFRDFQDALSNGDLADFDATQDKVYPSADTADLPSGMEAIAKQAAGPVADRWDVSREDLAALFEASGGKASPGKSLDELKREYVTDTIVGHNSAGHVATIAAGVAVAERHGWPVELTDDQQADYDYVKARPAAFRALTGLTAAQYETTQAWFKERGVSEVTVARGMHRADGDREGLPFTSWAAGYGGVIGSAGGGGGFNVDFDDAEALQKEFDQERSIRVATIPVERIYSTALTGPGTKHESEVVVLPMPAATKPGDDPLTKKYQQARPNG